MTKRKAEKETKKDSPNKKTKKTELEKKSKRKTINDELDQDVVVTKKTRSGKLISIIEDKPVEQTKPVKQAKKVKEIIVIDPDIVLVSEKKKSEKKTSSKNVEKKSTPTSSPIIRKEFVELSKQPVLKKITSESAKSKSTTKIVKKVVFEGAATIVGKDYDADGEIFQQVEQMWTVFDIVVLISLSFNALILLGSKYLPEYAKDFDLHVNYESFEDGFMQYIKLVMWSFPTVVSLYTTIVFPFILIEKGVSKVFGFKDNTTIRVYLLLVAILGSIIYYFDPKLDYLLQQVIDLSPKTRHNLRNVSIRSKLISSTNLVGNAVLNTIKNPVRTAKNLWRSVLRGAVFWE